MPPETPVRPFPVPRLSSAVLAAAAVATTTSVLKRAARHWLCFRDVLLMVLIKYCC